MPGNASRLKNAAAICTILIGVFILLVIVHAILFVGSILFGLVLGAAGAVTGGSGGGDELQSYGRSLLRIPVVGILCLFFSIGTYIVLKEVTSLQNNAKTDS